jgi:hypothetical protein
MNRRIRRCRPPVEPSGAVSRRSSTPSNLLATLRTYCDALQQDGDSYDAWIGLSEVFAALDDQERVRCCRDVALRLHPAAPSLSALPH